MPFRDADKLATEISKRFLAEGIHADADQGWGMDDYSHWQPLPQPAELHIAERREAPPNHSGE